MSFKKLLILFLILVSGITIISNKEYKKVKLSFDNNKKNKIAQKNIKYKVTFIELGSINCIPCKMMQPIMKEIEEEYKDTVKVIFYDVKTTEGNPYVNIYKIRVIPTQIFLDENGVEYYRHEGFFPKEELVNILKLKL